MSSILVLVMLVLTVATLTLTTTATIRVSQDSPFCSLSLPILRCVFANTTQNVELGKVNLDGVKEVRVEAASHFHTSPQCLTILRVGSSNDVKVQGGAAPNTENISTPMGKEEGRRRKETHQQAYTHQQSPGNTSSRRSIRGLGVERRGSDGEYDGEVKEDWCSRNVSVTQSRVSWLRGQFDRVSIQLSPTDEVSGEIRVLDIKRTSPLVTLAVKVDEVILMNSTVQNVTQLEVNERLLINNVRIGRVGPQAIIVNGRSEQSQGGLEFTLSSVVVNVMETGAMRVRGGHLSINDLTFGMLRDGAMVVEPGGKLTLNNVRVLHASYACLVLEPNATLILDNFMLENNTIPHMKLFTGVSQVFVLPLLAISPQESVKDTQQEKAFPGFSWYWLVVMAVVGQVSGLVIGSAVMWRRPDLTKGLPSISLSELLGRERSREEAEGHTNEGMCRSGLQRQDSGLTSSSFASFVPGHERQRSSSTLLPPIYKPPNPELEPAHSNTYVQLQSPSENPEQVIYEEVDNFAQCRPESTYLAMH
ncbi:hypothetical protein Pmani_019122 [Petrolisthes manimaculis]|uniref:Transmembrane protein n=1 Tax=Petrolisthes manimaculis TaxID=1843537 RepID=A0AAE1PL33_9EUCA|nr:hypothetical protein Pmani_019122 [Petrolisthes manimaculis]